MTHSYQRSRADEGGRDGIPEINYNDLDETSAASVVRISKQRSVKLQPRAMVETQR